MKAIDVQVRRQRLEFSLHLMTAFLAQSRHGVLSTCDGFVFEHLLEGRLIDGGKCGLQRSHELLPLGLQSGHPCLVSLHCLVIRVIS